MHIDGLPSYHPFPLSLLATEEELLATVGPLDEGEGFVLERIEKFFVLSVRVGHETTPAGESKI